MYQDYAKNLNASEKVLHWVNHNLKNYLKKNPENQEEIEHIIDFLVSDEAPVKMDQMSYSEALKSAEKWTKKLIKKGEHIKETPEDTEVLLDFKDGFKIVKLIGRAAYEREGFLMRHCVASYFGSDKEIYSLRDENNMPHCTMEKDQQIKGKGNGNIHPKYIGYVVKFLEKVGMTVGDSEMAHLGYMNVTKIKKFLHADTKYFAKKYLPQDAKLLNKEGQEFASLDLLDIKPLISEFDTELKLNFDLKTFIPLSIDFLFKRSKKGRLVSDKWNAQVATSGDSSKVATSGDSSKVATSGYSSQVATSGDSSQVATSGDSSQVATSGYSSKVATSGDYSKVATSGDYSKVATSGYSSKVEVLGAKSVGANIGINGKIKASHGSWITLAEYDDNYIVKCVKSAQIDGKKLLPDTWYELKNGKFQEVK